jgi:hypothetical protein
MKQVATKAKAIKVKLQIVNVKRYSCPSAQRIKHYTMKAYGGVDV